MSPTDRTAPSARLGPLPDFAFAPHSSLEAKALALVLDGTATSRTELRERLGVSASTTSSLVRRLLEANAIEESRSERSTGGRRPARLHAARDDVAWLVAELGGYHMRLGLSTARGPLTAVEEVPLDLSAGPEATLELVRAGWDSLVDEAPGHTVLAAAIGLPGPVSALTGELIAPARMPGWHGVRFAERLSDAMGVPVLVENDARAATLGEFIARKEAIPELLYVKAGSGIGAGLVSRGQLVHGGSGVAGDITHVLAPGAEGRQCSCGRVGCLETVASGAAIRRELLDQGLGVASMADIVELAVTFHPAATAAVRRSGKQLGTALSPLINFLNPSAVIVGGALSGIDAYVAAVRSAIYDSGLAMVTQDLVIEPAVAGRDAALLGLTQIAQHAAPLRLPS